MFYSLIGALDPKLHFNDGMREVVRFEYAPNTITNASASLNVAVPGIGNGSPSFDAQRSSDSPGRLESGESTPLVLGKQALTCQ